MSGLDLSYERAPGGPAATTPPGGARTEAADDLLTRLVPWILGGAVMFNAVLAVINANVKALSRGHVMLAEILLVAVILLLTLRSWRRSMFPWYALIYFFGLLFFVGILINLDVNLKYIRDAITFPVYVMLGMLWVRHRFVPVFTWIHGIVFAVLILEAFWPDVYARTFDVTDYYINTRGVDPAAFQYTTQGFFISAMRGDRFIPGFDWLHRTSSVFLEPVSLGNYAIVATILILTFWREMGWANRIFMAFSTVAILIGCDGRLATVTCVIIVMASPFFAYMPKYSAVFYLPGMIGSAALIVYLLGFQSGIDNFPGRMAGGIDILENLDLAELLGYAEYANTYVDAGFAYFLVSQSIFGAMAMWLFMTIGFGEETRQERIFIHSCAAYFVLSLLISYSVFSVKTASLMWFSYGYLLATRIDRHRSGDGAPSMSEIGEERSFRKI